jgi:hypothetical protein
MNHCTPANKSQLMEAHIHCCIGSPLHREVNAKGSKEVTMSKDLGRVGCCL